ncbi:prephenate dehydrogenase/arogenate dehydrogenase family protein [bacterium]|nr:prephenate dehydrogenase/arogenate dehydrogenase family protein [bacterium]
MIKVGIIGLGLIGGSILKALSKHSEYELYCYSNSSYKKALQYCKNASNDINIISSCDIIFTCCEASKTQEILETLNNFLNKNNLVVDVTSIKKNLLNKTYNFNFILSHPMAGTEKSGFDASFEELFIDSKWLIEKEDEILIKIIQDLKAKPLKINMSNHDELCAQISHLPTILSFLLFDLAQDEALQIASSGFRDTTRLAMTNGNLALSMFNNNKENILKHFDKLIEKLNSLKNLSDNEKINLFDAIAQKRAKMYDSNGKNIFKI